MTPDAVRSFLRADFPKAFASPTPLAKSVAVELKNWGRENFISEEDIHDAVFSWVRRREYLSKIVEGGFRYDLWGHPAERITNAERFYSLNFQLDLDTRRAVHEAEIAETRRGVKP